MLHEFEIHGRLPGLNEIIGANRAHRMAGATQKKSADKICAQYILLGRVPVFTGSLQVHFDWFVDDRRDPDNIRSGAKFILDALVETGRIPNDNQKTIIGLSDTFTRVKENPRVRVTLERVADKPV